MLSHQAAKRLADEHLRATGSPLVAGSAGRERDWPVWVVGYLDPGDPGGLLAGGALVVTDDGDVHAVGSAPGAMERLVEDLGCKSEEGDTRGA